MLRLHDGVILYHGSSVEVSAPDLELCSPKKDFGRGFCLTSSVDQARSFSRIVTRRMARENPSAKRTDGVVSRFEMRDVGSLDVRTFPTADADWLRCVVAHRQGGMFQEAIRALAGVDAIVGKVANDQTNATLLAYLAGAYGPVGSRAADEICLGLLLPDRLEDQVCLRTPKALACLVFKGSEKVRP